MLKKKGKQNKRKLNLKSRMKISQVDAKLVELITCDYWILGFNRRGNKHENEDKDCREQKSRFMIVENKIE